jgi:signal recognition particle subunit SRP54
MFDKLTSTLTGVFKNLRGHGKLTETNVRDALREIRLALLEADVNFQVVKDFMQRVESKTLGEKTLEGVNPGQQFVKRVHDELVELLGGESRDFNWTGRPTVVMMIGLHGAGKTTTTGKLARRWREQGKKVMLVGCDIRRPAAVDQLGVLARQAGVDFTAPLPGEAVADIGLRARDLALRQGHDIVVLDTGGRFQIDDDLVQELADLKLMVNPKNVVMVVDAAMGQESVNVAKTFHEKVGLTGLILTKLDGDARGGAALSIRQVTGCPVLLVGVGEKQEDLEAFHPDRMASRILGMGDVVSLVEKAQQSVDLDTAKRMEEKLFGDQMNLEDFLFQIQQMKKMGPMDKLMDMMPGLPSLDSAQKQQAAAQGAKQTKKFEAIILSMTPQERRRPTVLNARRKIRIAKGSGMQVRDVNDLLKHFDQMKDMGKKLKKMQKMLRRFGR